MLLSRIAAEHAEWPPPGFPRVQKPPSCRCSETDNECTTSAFDLNTANISVSTPRTQRLLLRNF